MERNKSKKGQIALSQFPQIGFTIGISVLVLGILALVLVQTSDSVNNNEVTKTTQNGTLAINNLVSQLPLIGTIVGLAVLIGIVVVAFRQRG